MSPFTERETLDLHALRERIGGPSRASEWLVITQERVNGFAADTGDDAFIHVDPERATRTRFGGTIAHGLLTLSLLPTLMRTATPLLAESRMGVNYGFDRVRFLSPVPVDSRVRGHFALTSIDEARPGFVKISYDVSVEIDGSEHPALVARWTLGHWLRNVISQ